MLMTEVKQNKKEFLPLLLLADESEQMIDNYLDHGQLFVFEENDLIGVCVVTNKGINTYEIKNMAVTPNNQRRGYGRKIMNLISEHYQSLGATKLIVGTGESPLTLPFYEANGFEIYDRIPDFFTNNYSEPIMEDGVLLKDMILLRKKL